MGYSQLRRGRASISGQAYHIIATTLQRTPVFSDFRRARIAIRVLMDEDKLGAVSTLAFVLMPDHLHWLIELGDRADMRNVVGRVKSLIARRLDGAIWQPGFYDHALRKDEDIATVARYIVANPVRAGLVSKLGDYPHWDAIWM
jgi:REP element-mobilizing transposase RayT